jgi:hypothetical protein
MRPHRLSWLFALAAALVASAPASAQRLPLEFSVVVEPGASYSDYEGFELDAGYGVGFAVIFSESFALDLRGLRSDGSRAEVETSQVGLRRAVGGGGAWQPFVLAGLHFQRSELEHQVVCVRAPCPPLVERHEDLGVFAGGGVDWRFASRAALRLDGRLAVYDSERSDGTEESVDVTAGLVVRF